MRLGELVWPFLYTCKSHESVVSLKLVKKHPSERKVYGTFTPCKGIQIPESGKFLLVESGILGFGIWNTAQAIWNSAYD